MGDKHKLVHRFSKADPITALFDIAAHALAEQDGLPLVSPFDVIAPGGHHLLKAGHIVAGERGKGDDLTIESQQLGGASVLVRRSKTN